MNVNKVLKSLGKFGRFQAFIFFLVTVTQFVSGVHMLASVFLMGEPKFRCLIPQCEESSSASYKSFHEFAAPMKNAKTPKQCKKYEPIEGKDSCEKDSFNTDKPIPCKSYVYDTTFYDQTIVTEYDIVCNKSTLVATSQSLYMTGVLIGSVGFGVIADMIGRRKVILISTLLMIASAVITSFSPNLATFTALRCLCAMGLFGMAMTSFVLATEYFGTSHRLVCCIMCQMGFPFGELLICFCAYYVRNWRYLNLWISVPTVTLISFYWLFPESVRWLIKKGHEGEARRILLKIARWNKVTLPDSIFESEGEEETDEHQANEEGDELEEQSEENKKEFSSGPYNLIKTPIMRKWSLNLFFNWMVNSMVYYGLSLHASNLSRQIYYNFALLSITEIPGIIVATITLMYYGRRPILCIMMVFGGIACICTVFIPSSASWLLILLATLGKGAISGSFSIIFIYTAEIYPTTIRSTGMGVSSMSARIGGIVVPFVNYLSKLYAPLPMIIFGVLSTVSGVMVLALPETRNRDLPDTVEEAERLA